MNYILLLGMPGGGELFVIVLFIIMFFGAKKIPELARTLGKGMRELKDATDDIQREIKGSTHPFVDIKEKIDIKKQVKDLMEEKPVVNVASNEEIEEGQQKDEETIKHTIKRGEVYSTSQQPKEGHI